MQSVNTLATKIIQRSLNTIPQALNAIFQLQKYGHQSLFLYP